MLGRRFTASVLHALLDTLRPMSPAQARTYLSQPAVAQLLDAVGYELKELAR